MRIMFVCFPQVGHVHPLFPLAHAAVDAGHDVQFASGASMGDRIRHGGFDHVDIGPDDPGPMFGALAERVGGEPGAGLAPQDVTPWFLRNLFAATAVPMMLPDLLRASASWSPDLIVHDTVMFAGPIAAAVAEVPSALHSVGTLIPTDVLASLDEVLAPMWREQGVEPEPMAGSFRNACLSIAPPALEIPVAAPYAEQVQPLRPVGFSGTSDETLPAWVDALPDVPTIYVTMGTFMNTNRDVFRAVLDGLADEPVNVIVTVGRNNETDFLNPVPSNARVEQYIPQSALLPHCALVVSHVGSGTLLPALGAGIPQVLVPQGADNFTNAARCVDAGVGRRLMPEELTADSLRDAVRTVLDDSSYREAATRVAGEIAAMPGPDEVIAGLTA